MHPSYPCTHTYTQTHTYIYLYISLHCICLRFDIRFAVRSSQRLFVPALSGGFYFIFTLFEIFFFRFFRFFFVLLIFVFLLLSSRLLTICTEIEFKLEVFNPSVR